MGRGGRGVERETEGEIYTVFPQHLNRIGCNNASTIQYQNGKYSLSLTPTHSSVEKKKEGEERRRRWLMYRLQYEKKG